MTARRDVEVTLHLIALQIPKDSTTIRRVSSFQFRRFLEFSLLTPDFPEYVSHVSVLFLLFDHVSAFQLMATGPLAPARCVSS